MVQAFLLDIQLELKPWKSYPRGPLSFLTHFLLVVKLSREMLWPFHRTSLRDGLGQGMGCWLPSSAPRTQELPELVSQQMLCGATPPFIPLCKSHKLQVLWRKETRKHQGEQ